MAHNIQHALLNQLGFAAKPDWIEQCCQFLQTQDPGFIQMSPQTQLQRVLEQLLVSDFRQCGAGGPVGQMQVSLTVS